MLRSSFSKNLGIAACAAAAMFLCAVLSRAQSPAQARVPAPPATPALREVTDEIGRTIRIPQTLHRVISLSPGITETIYALGLQDLLVGDTDYCDFPPDAQHKPKVGGAINPSLEAIADLHPDLVLATKSLNRLDTVLSLCQPRDSRLHHRSAIRRSHSLLDADIWRKSWAPQMPEKPSPRISSTLSLAFRNA